MWISRCKYAFVTNYWATIFLNWDEDCHTKKPILYYSNAISWEDRSIIEQDRQTSDRSSCPEVSVRECTLYLQSLVESGNWRAKVSCPLEAWVEDSATKKKSESISSLDKARARIPWQNKGTNLGDSRGDQSKSFCGRGERKRR